MKNLKILRFEALLFLAVLVATSHAGKKYRVTARGKVTCKMEDGSIEPLKGIRVKLLDRDLVFHDTFGTTRTTTSGRFYVTGRARDLFGKPDPFIQIVYDYRGKYGHMEIDGFAGVTRKTSTRKRRYKRYINFGTIQRSDDHCRAYVRFYDALKDYYKRTGSKVPYGTLNVRTHVILHGRTPYAYRSKINVPKRYRISKRTAMHELAHTVRHTLDGSFAHFLWDVIRFGYARKHSCHTKTNLGFAFNEGFAQFWSNDCKRQYYGSSPTDYRYEGNVANALRRLQTSCRLTDRQMINVLKRNRKKIHSFNDFKRRSGCR